MEVLTVYVREKARWKEGAQERDGEEANRMPTDIQAILTVLSRRDRGYESDGQRLDPTGTDLRHADLGDAHLERATLVGANLYGAHLERAHLRGGNFYRANLGGANLGGANLERANLGEANLEGANLGEANLVGADLSRTHLESAILDGANLLGVVGLTQEQLDSASSYEDATLPDYLEEATAAGQEGD